MVKTNLYLLVIALLFIFTKQAPKEEEVHLPIGGYTHHKWYSGMFVLRQVISISRLATIIMYFLTRNVILTMIRWCSG